MKPEFEASTFFRVSDLPAKQVLDGVAMRSVDLDNLMMTFVEYAAGARVPTHFHPYEQITYVLEGQLEVVIGDVHEVLGPGEGVCISPNVEHSSRPINGPAKALDAWTPVPERFKVRVEPPPR